MVYGHFGECGFKAQFRPIRFHTLNVSESAETAIYSGIVSGGRGVPVTCSYEYQEPGRVSRESRRGSASTDRVSNSYSEHTPIELRWNKSKNIKGVECGEKPGGSKPG